MAQRLVYTLVILFSFSSLIAQPNSGSQKKNIVYPFKEVLKGIDSLVIQGGPRIVQEEAGSAVYGADIEKLANLYFQNKDFAIEAYGISPCGSIQLIHQGKPLATVACWDLNDTYYAVNVAMNGKYVYHGLLINKSYLDKLFDRLKNQTGN